MWIVNIYWPTRHQGNMFLRRPEWEKSGSFWKQFSKSLPHIHMVTEKLSSPHYPSKMTTILYPAPKENNGCCRPWGGEDDSPFAWTTATQHHLLHPPKQARSQLNLMKMSSNQICLVMFNPELQGCMWPHNTSFFGPTSLTLKLTETIQLVPTIAKK